jgi:catechol 2,3-dioxygenase-like lactoylglutathione lyase family enzyme
MDILEIKILTDNLDETESFYAGLLGLKTTNKDQSCISFLAGQSNLTFIKSNKLNPKYHFAFNIPRNKLDEAIKWVSARVDLLKHPDNRIIADFKSWNAKAIYFYDNNGNILEFIARFDLKNDSDKVFGGSSVQSISEIGIVADEPLKLANQLVEENNLYFFEKDAKSEKFVTLGNDHGLFIIVKTNRKWYPTEQRAGKYYTKIKIAINGFMKEIIMNEGSANLSLDYDSSRPN